MCNRYSKTDKKRVLASEFGQLQVELEPRYNIAPTQSAPVFLVENGRLACREMRWGWQTNAGAVTNARAETAHQKMWKRSWESGRCIVPADGYYEWTKEKPAQPYRFVRATGHPFYFAGLHENGCFAILTGSASAFVRCLHERQPIVIRESAIDWWLAPAESRQRDGLALMARDSSATLTAYKVTPEMTNPRFESPAAVAPFTPAQESFLRHRIESDEWRWREMSDRPAPGTSALMLIDDETVERGRWDGERWRTTKGREGIKWRPLKSNEIGHGGRSL